MKNHRVSIYVICGCLIFLGGCFKTLEQRWEAFDTERQSEIGVKSKDYYIGEWGKPAKRMKAADGDEILIWEFSGYGGAQGWRKALTFGPDGLLKDFSRDYWPKEAT